MPPWLPVTDEFFMLEIEVNRCLKLVLEIGA